MTGMRILCLNPNRTVFVTATVAAELRAVLGPGVVPQFSDTPGGIRNAGPPAPGCDNEAFYGGLLGLPEDEIAALRTAGVI